MTEPTQPLEPGSAAWLLSNLRRLLDQLGDRSSCRFCGAPIYWIRYRSGARAPITPDGLNHFADCPAKHEARAASARARARRRRAGE